MSCLRLWPQGLLSLALPAPGRLLLRSCWLPNSLETLLESKRRDQGDPGFWNPLKNHRVPWMALNDIQNPVHHNTRVPCGSQRIQGQRVPILQGKLNSLQEPQGTLASPIATLNPKPQGTLKNSSPVLSQRVPLYPGFTTGGAQARWPCPSSLPPRWWPHRQLIMALFHAWLMMDDDGSWWLGMINDITKG